MKKKEEILEHINELKINYNALTLINRHLVREKKKGHASHFSAKDLKSKKSEILEMIRSEGEMVSAISTMKPFKNRTPLFSFDIHKTGIRKIFLHGFDIRKTGILKLKDPGNYGELGFDEGELIYAVYENYHGERAFFEMLSFQKGTGEFFPRKILEKPRTISENCSQLIKRTLDEK